MFASSALHKLIEGQTWNSVQQRIESHPGEARKVSNCHVLYDAFKKSKALPLHHAVAMDAPKNVIDDLLRAYPKAVRTTETAYHRTVLHVACMNRAAEDVVETIYLQHKKAIRVQDDMTRLPIHYAVANGCAYATIQMLFNEYPESAMVADNDGWLPLHVAVGCVHQAPLSIVKLIYALCPGASMVKDKDGMTPLELALSKRNDPTERPLASVIRFLQDVRHRIPLVVDVPVEAKSEHGEEEMSTWTTNSRGTASSE